jgi:flavin reductase (DIM6/NTAB) family NADH-FMN oxidoreductase RutF
MAAALTAAASPAGLARPGADLVISVLAANQAALAARFARADVGVSPFDGLPHMHTADGLPYIGDALGALSCKLVAPAWPLHDLDAIANPPPPEERRVQEPWKGEGVASELYLARVVRVERTTPEAGASKLPLIYHHRAYTTILSDSGAGRP